MKRTFAFLTEGEKAQLLDQTIIQDIDPSNSIKRTYKLYKYHGNDVSSYEKDPSIGEIVYTNQQGSLGLAMVNLDVLHQTEGNFLALEMIESTDNKDVLVVKPGQALKFITTFQPTWFQGLDTKTNLPTN